MEHRTGLGTVVREWGRIGCIGFGGPPAHIALLRQLCVERRQWLDAQEFEDAIAACNLLPGPASTELAIFCAWRVRGRVGALAGGLAFILPGLACILAAIRAVPDGHAAAVGEGRRGRGGRRGGRGRGPGRLDAARAKLDAGGQGRPGSPVPLGGIPAGRRGGGRDDRPVAGAGPARLRGRRAGGCVGARRCGEVRRGRGRGGRESGRGGRGRRPAAGEAGEATAKARGIAALPALPGLLPGRAGWRG